MSLEAFAAPGRFHRGNLHTHSSRSDGALPPDEVYRGYAAEGYDFICVSDHFLERCGFPMTDTTAYRTETFKTLIGAEMHAPATALSELRPILAIGLPLRLVESHVAAGRQRCIVNDIDLYYGIT